MNMKKILQAMDGISTRPVAGADSMARFLRVVKEAELNQPAAIQQPEPSPPYQGVTVNSKPYVHAPGPDDPNFERYVYLMWKYEFLDNERTGKGNLIKVDVAVSDESNAEIDRLKYEAEKLAGPNLPAWEKARIGYRTDPEYIKYSQDMAAKMSAELLEDVGMSRFLSIMNEGKSPHKVALPVQMAMQHYQTPVKQAINETSSVFKTYVALVEDDISEKKIAKQQLIRQYSQRIAEAVLMKERVVGGEETPPGINRLTGKPNPPEAAPADTPAVVPLGKRFDPRFKNGPEPYTIDIDGVVYKFAGRTATGPGTGEVIKVPAAVIGIRGLSAVSVELGKDGMYYPAPATNESKNIKR